MYGIYHNNVNKLKQYLSGYSPKQFNSRQEFLNYVGNFLFKTDPDNPYILANSLNWREAQENNTFTEDMLCEGYKLWYEISHNDIVRFANNNLGDGNPLEMIYVLFDRTNKEYTLVNVSGYYSSWDSSEFNSCTQVELEEKTVGYFQGVTYASN